MRILMLGNSFTYCNDMPDMLAALTGAEVASHTRGGAMLSEHLNPETEMGARTLKALSEEKWDYVILQEQSNAPVTKNKGFLAAAQRLCTLIRENGAKPVFYATWAYREGSEKLASMNMDYAAMDSALSAAYREAAEINGALIAEVGAAFTALRKHAELYAPDDYHPSEAGSITAAAVIADAIKTDILTDT